MCIRDRCLISLCNGAIIPNSTFSWWGSWLQKDRKYDVVYQFPYFGSFFSESHRNLKDFYPKGWVKGQLSDELIDNERNDVEKS